MIRRLLPLIVLLGIAWPTPAAAQTGEVIEYYALDQLGSVRVVFDANGNIIGRMDYGPFGQSLSGGTNMPDRMYAGLFRDGEVELDAAGARSYQVRTGRFTTVDPVYAGLFEPQRWNRYAYALNAPVSETDPSGLLSQGTTPGCNAEFSFLDCGGNGYFWGPPDEAGFGFGSGLAEAKRLGYFEGMPPDMWDALQSFHQRAEQAFADAQQAKREPEASVLTNTVIVMPDGSKVSLNDCTVDNGCMKLGMVPMLPGGSLSWLPKVASKLPTLIQRALFYPTKPGTGGNPQFYLPKPFGTYLGHVAPLWRAPSQFTLGVFEGFVAAPGAQFPPGTGPRVWGQAVGTGVQLLWPR